jgi:hypothetical protein
MHCTCGAQPGAEKMDRITEKDLKAIAARINEVTGSPMATWTRTDDGGMVANVGNYHLSFAYGGVNLERVTNQGGGVTCPLGMGHGPKRALWDKMQAFLSGLEAKAA